MATDRKKIDQACPGCRYDRYNHRGMCERPGIDAPVTSDECMFAERFIKYNRMTKRYKCRMKS